MIVHPTRTALGMRGAVLSALSVWVLAVSCALPNYVWRKLEEYHVGLPYLPTVAFCFEEWPTIYGRAYYSVFVLVVQFFLPILTVSSAYYKISRKLADRCESNDNFRTNRNKRYVHDVEDNLPTNNISTISDKNLIPSEDRFEEINTTDRCKSSIKKSKSYQRSHRVNELLLAITIAFSISWLPLNLFNVIVDFAFSSEYVTENMLVVYVMCHMCGMSSACSNPFLYGWLNHNFRHEFADMFSCLTCLWSRVNNEEIVGANSDRGEGGLELTAKGPVLPRALIYTTLLTATTNNAAPRMETCI